MSDVGAAIDALIASVIEATAKATMDGAMLVKSLAQAEAPHKTGRLAGSIDVTGPGPTGSASFEALVGPTVVYGRLRELGGWIPGGASPQPKPPGKRDWLHWVDEAGNGHFSKLVYQTGRPYLKPAVEGAELRFRSILANRVGDAIRFSTY